MPPSADDIARKLANDFRRRRIERSLTRKDVSKKSGVPLANLARFEQKGLISLNNLIMLSIALGYVNEMQEIFSAPKFSTVEELAQIHKNQNKKKAYHSHEKN